MFDLTPFGTSLAIAALVGVLLWFTFGTQANVRRGNAILRWLQGGLPRFGKRATLRWLGSSAATLQIVEPAAPFREVTVLVVLEPRDIPFIWAFTRARRRRDLIIVRAALQRAPTFDFEASSDASWLTAEDIDDESGWRAIDWAPGASAIANLDPGPGYLGAIREAWSALNEVPTEVWRISVRRTVPHLELHVRPPDDARANADRLVEPIRRLAIALSPDTPV